MNTESLNDRTQLIESLQKAINDCNVASIISLTSSLNTERYSKDEEI